MKLGKSSSGEITLITRLQKRFSFKLHQEKMGKPSGKNLDPVPECSRPDFPEAVGRRKPFNSDVEKKPTAPFHWAEIQTSVLR